MGRIRYSLKERIKRSALAYGRTRESVTDEPSAEALDVDRWRNDDRPTAERGLDGRHPRSSTWDRARVGKISRRKTLSMRTSLITQIQARLSNSSLEIGLQTREGRPRDRRVGRQRSAHRPFPDPPTHRQHTSAALFRRPFPTPAAVRPRLHRRGTPTGRVDDHRRLQLLRCRREALLVQCAPSH